MGNITTVRVRYKETDQMGVVYYGNYFTWFEVGRNEFFRKLKSSCEELEVGNILLPVIKTGCEYLVPAKFDDEICIDTQLVKLKGVRMELRYKIYREKDNTLLAKGFTEHVFVDKNLKPINFRKKHKDIWNELQGMIE